MFKWKTDFHEWYGEYTELTFDNKKEAIMKAKYLLDKGVDLNIEFNYGTVRVYMAKGCLKKHRRFLFDIE
jgi:hypothetical protein